MVNQKDPHEQRHEAQVPVRNVKAGVREEEVCQIYNLKKNLDYSDVLIKYANKYLKLGWDLVAVNAQGQTAQDLDFRQPEESWSPKLTTLGLEGVQINLGVRTGRPSRLLVLEVHRDESLAPFNQRGDWGSGCVAEVGTEREQHYYVVPRGWQPPPSYFLESFQVMIFGEEGLVLAPPSLEPKAQATLRWLRPPWENPPTRPSPALCKFLKESCPPCWRTPRLSIPRCPPGPKSIRASPAFLRFCRPCWLRQRGRRSTIRPWWLRPGRWGWSIPRCFWGFCGTRPLEMAGTSPALGILSATGAQQRRRGARSSPSGTAGFTNQKGSASPRHGQRL
jgi:hypothetical protein